MAADLEMVATAVAAHDEEIRQLCELHDLHTQMLEALNDEVQSLTTAMGEMLGLLRAVR